MRKCILDQYDGSSLITVPTSSQVSSELQQLNQEETVSSKSDALVTTSTPTNSNRIEKPHLVYYDFEQGSVEWIQVRNKYITASAISKITNSSETVEYKNLVAEKASDGQHRTFFGSDATRWGHRYEPVADMLFEHRNKGVEIYEYGLIYNPNYPYLGVSPDGITSQNEMLEIKCPYSRKIDGKIKKEYFHQIQQQLLVCEHDICNFLECKFVEVDEKHFWNVLPNNRTESGIIIQSSESGEKFNYYSPIELCNNETDLRDWQNYRLEDIESIGGNIVKITYWMLEKYLCQKVKRDPEWYPTHKQRIERFWEDVSKAKDEGWEKLIKPKKSPPKKTPICLI